MVVWLDELQRYLDGEHGLTGHGHVPYQEVLHVPFVSRDDIKTGLHVTYRSDDPNEVWRFSATAFELFYEVASMYLRAEVSIVVEAAFHAGRSEPDLARLAALGS